MSTAAISLIVFGCIFAAAMLGMLLRRVLPAHHLTAETKETVKVAMGFLATMGALILGLLVASAKDSFDKQATGVTQMSAKIVYLDRVLANYGAETKQTRALYRQAVEQVTHSMWPETRSQATQLDPSASHTESLLTAIQSLEPQSELQKTLKAQAVSTCLELGQMRWLEYELAGTTASLPMIWMLVFWLSVLFVSFGMYAPSNGTVLVAFLLAAFSVAGAVLLILELRTPFTGLLQIPNTSFLDALQHLGR